MNKAKRVPPVADPGTYPKVFAATGQTVEVELAASNSYSPVGNPLNYQWSYLGFQADALSVDNLEFVTATLEPGKHPFNLTVTDTVSDLSSSKFFFIDVEEKRDTTVSVNYGIDALWTPIHLMQKRIKR